MTRLMGWRNPGLFLFLAQLIVTPDFVGFTPSVIAAIPQELPAIFAESYEEDYRAYHCDFNIHSLLQRMSQQRISLRGSYVLYLYDPEDLGALFGNGGYSDGINPSSPRQRVRAWGFHVVLDYQGMILDLDYTEEPLIVPIQEYFMSMFPEESSQMFVRPIPTSDYLRDYTEDGDHSYFYYLLDSPYPGYPVEDYIAARS